MDRERTTRLVPIPGTPPSLIRVPSGCPFHPRCRYASLTGGRSETRGAAAARAVTPGHLAACHLTAAQRTRQWAALLAGQVPEHVRSRCHKARARTPGSARQGGSVTEQTQP